MAFRDSITKIGVNLFIEQPAQRQGLATLQKRLQITGDELTTRLKTISDNKRNRDLLRHIIAIEKWGQRRLKVALGEALLQDENHTYKPVEETSWEDLKSLYAITRLETKDLSRQLNNSDMSQKILHNQLGPLSIVGWLRYLNKHAELEGRKIR
jgi:hypothetical protein